MSPFPCANLLTISDFTACDKAMIFLPLSRLCMPISWTSRVQSASINGYESACMDLNQIRSSSKLHFCRGLTTKISAFWAHNNQDHSLYAPKWREFILKGSL